MKLNLLKMKNLFFKSKTEIIQETEEIDNQKLLEEWVRNEMKSNNKFIQWIKTEF